MALYNRVDYCEEHSDCIIVFEGNKYPICNVIKGLEAEKQDLSDKLEELQSNYNILEAEIDNGDLGDV